MKSDKYELTKGIKIPKLAPGPGLKYPFDRMEVGDSFEVDNRPDRQKVRVSALAYARKHKGKRKFTVRRWEDKWRCWRIA